MALPPTGSPGAGPGQGPARQSLLDLADLDAGARRRRRRRRKTLAGVVAAGCALAGLLVLVTLQIRELGPAVRAARGEGTRGEFTLRQYGCGRFSCTWTGVFTADQGGPRLADVAFSGRVPGGAHRGLAVPALYTGDQGTVYPVTGSNAWIADVAWLAVEGLAIASSGGAVAYGIRTRRDLRDLWQPMTPADREALRRGRARFGQRVARKLRRQRNRRARTGSGRHTAR